MSDSPEQCKDNGASAPTRWTSGALADALGATLVGPGDIALTRVGGVDDADETTLTFIRDAKYAMRWADSPSPCAIVSRSAVPEGARDARGRALLVVDDADAALIQLLATVAPAHARPPVGAHPSAVVDASATIGADARIGPNVVVSPRAVVGAGASLHAGVALGAGARIGAACDIRAGVVIDDRCVVGDRVVIHPNSVIGADGFGYRPGANGPVKIPHAGDVVIGDDVEIGACVTIDRATFGSTRIGSGTKIDNHVQIGHNCEIGAGCVICGACGLSGSVRVGDGATLGGGVGVKDNIAIGAGATIGARSGVMNNIPPGETWVGYPARPARDAMRIIAAENRLPELVSAVSRLERCDADARSSARSAEIAEPSR